MISSTRGMPGLSSHIFKGPHRCHDILANIRLRNKECVRRDFQGSNLPCRDDDVNRRPSVSYGSGQFQPVHGTGHVDVRENEVNVLTSFENGDRLISVIRNNYSITGLFEFFRDEFSNKRFILEL